MGQIDEFIGQAAAEPSEKKSNTLLSKVSKVIGIVGLVNFVIGLISLFISFDKDEYVMIAFLCIIGGLSLIFYGLVGQCLDDIRMYIRK